MLHPEAYTTCVPLVALESIPIMLLPSQESLVTSSDKETAGSSKEFCIREMQVIEANIYQIYVEKVRCQFRSNYHFHC